MYKLLFIVALTAGVHLTANGGTVEQQAKIRKAFNDLRATNIEILDNFYAKDGVFIDPIDTQNGIDEIKGYYKNIYKNVTDIAFEEKEMISEGNNHVFVWLMKLKAKGLNGGKEVLLDGTSVIKFNDQGLVSYHRDYYDMGEFIYEHIPVLGFVVKKTKQKLRHK